MICENCHNHIATIAEQEPALHDASLQTPRMLGLLQSHDRPLDAEEVTMRDARSAHHKRLAELSDQILQLGVALEHLKQIRVQVLDSISKYDTVLHPMRRLPDEVLSEISLACINTDLWNEYDRTKACSQAAARCISHVCRRWRTISINLPRLWSYMYIDLDPTSDANGYRLLLALQLERSRTCPLTIWVEWATEWAKDNPVLSPLLMTSERWRTLILVGERQQLKAIFGPIRGSLHSLQNLCVELDDGSGLEVVSPIDCFEFAPNLRELKTNDPNSLILPMSQLATWETAGPMPFADRTLIKMLNIEFCYLRFSSTNAVTHSMHVLSHLKHMSLWTTDEGDISQFIEQFTLPALEELELDGSCKNISSISSLLQRSNARLRKLVLRGVSPDGAALTSILEATPELRSLQIPIRDCLDDSLIHRLTFREGTIALLPRLSVMHLSGGPLGHRELFVEMIKSRCTPTELDLETVILTPATPFSQSELAALKMCTTEGLYVKNGDEFIVKEEGTDGDAAEGDAGS